jgi:hypothetical protein
MEDVEFEEPKTYTITARKTPFLVGLVMRFSRGKIETEIQANITLLFLAGIIFLLSFFVSFFGNDKKESSTVSPEVIRASIEKMKNPPHQ